jgi:GAF domain-containing protein
MNLFHVEQTPMDERDVIVARAFADLAAISVLQHRAVTETRRINEQLTGALASRVVIESSGAPPR